MRPHFLRPATFALLLAASPVMLAYPVSATAQTPPAAADQGAQAPAAQFIQNLGNQAIAVIANKSLAEADKQAQYRKLLHDAFDLPTIARFVIGRSAWATMTPEQQTEYMQLFETLIVKTYGEKLTLYNGENFKVTGARQESERDSVVSSEIDHSTGQPPTSVDWRVRQKDGKYVIIDVIVEGVSLSVTQRSEYGAIVQRDGGKVDGLLNQMRQRVQDNNAGAPG